MKITLLFNNRNLIGKQILAIIKDNGYTKSSFSKLTGISRSTLDNLIKGECDSLTTYKTYMEKILESQNMKDEELLNYIPKHQEKKEDTLVVLGINLPETHTMSEKAKEMFDMLDSILHLCERYYH